ncbi:ASST-domain-containing protein [Lophiotrema nucula]|uniref:ASST-domain-containing protein n=1 Tax=Lophiotrema nucula TaxID=690887 RepID=A0A6A5YF70_9PLEO|nr:ASST-domain-containing protein [Lophiotrema nucula]
MGRRTFRTLVASLFAALPLAQCDSVSYDYDTYAEGDPAGAPYQTYLSNTDLKPLELQINSNQSGLASGYVFIGVNGEPTSTQNWPAIYDMSEERMGTLVWTGEYIEPFDFRAQTYKGQPVLTLFTGELLNGYGHGSYYILNQSYVEIGHFSPVGFENLGDLHEFSITADDTALVPIYHAVQADLTELGGASDAWIFECTFQEINIQTNKLLFEWNATTHVGFNESYNTIEDVGTEAAPFDYFHINSIEKDVNGDYLVSGRVMDCVYKISGDDGHIIWRLGGKQSDFQLDANVSFAFQHDARWVDDEQTRLTIFDNGPTDSVDYSRGLLLSVDQNAKTVSLIQDFYNGAKTFGQFEGSLQAINRTDPNTNFMLGYGSQPFFAEFKSNGDILLDAQFGKTNEVNGYRAYKLPWQGKPLTKPDIHFDSDRNQAYFSWNGATDVEDWVVYTANSTNTTSWMNVTSARRTGFETTIDLSDVELGTYVRGQAVNASGGGLGWTRASDGNQLYDAPDDVETISTTSMTSSSTSSSSSSTSTPITTSSTPIATSVTGTAPAPASSTTGAAVKLAHEVRGQVYVAAVVIVGGLIV